MVRSLQAISDTALAPLTLEDLLPHLLDRLRDILSVDTVVVLLLEGESLVARAARGLEEEVEQGVRIPLGRGFAGLTDEFGFVLVDAHYRHLTYPEIYAAGVAARLQLPSGPPEGLPKTGYLAAAAGRAVATNLAAAIRGIAPTARTLPRLLDLRILDGGDAGLLLAGAGAYRKILMLLDGTSYAEMVDYPARAILRVVGTYGVDLIIMATQGRAGSDRLAHSSVARHVLQHTPAPIVLVHITGQSEQAPDVETSHAFTGTMGTADVRDYAD